MNETHGICSRCHKKKHSTYMREGGAMICDKCFGDKRDRVSMSEERARQNALQDHGDSLHTLRATSFEFPAEISRTQAVELMTNGSCGD
jgi:hypothetical protein